MSDEIVWSASMDEAEFQRGVKKMITTVDSLKQKIKDLQTENAKAGKASQSANDALVSSMRRVAGEVFTIQAGISQVVQFYGRWQSEINRVTTAHHNLQTEIIKTLGASRDLANAQQIESALKGVKGLSPTEATKAFGSATAGAPGLDWQTRRDIVQGAAPLGAMGQDVGAHANLAAKLKQLDPTLSAADANDLALTMRERAGEDASRYSGDEFTSAMGRLTTAGLTARQALEVGMADVEADLPSKSLKRLSEALVAKDPHAGKRHLSAKERAESKLYGLSAAERYAAIREGGDAAEVFLGAGGKLAMQTMGRGQEQRAAIDAAYARDLVGEKRAQFEQFPTGRRAGIEHETAAQTERLDDIQGEPWAAASALRERYIADQRTRGQDWYSRWWKDTELMTRQSIAAMTGGDQLESVRAGIQGDIRFNEAAGGIGRRTDLPTAADAKVYDELVKALRENTAATKANTPKNAGAKKNVDRNTE